MPQSNLDKAKQLYGCDPDELAYAYSKLSDDDKKKYNKWETEKDYKQVLSRLEPYDLYEEIVHNLENGEKVYEEYILKLLKSMKPPRIPIKSKQEKIKVIEEVMLRTYFKAQYDTYDEIPTETVLLNKGKKDAAIIKNWLVEIANMDAKKLSAWEIKLISKFKSVTIKDGKETFEIDKYNLEKAYQTFHDTAVDYGIIIPKSNKPNKSKA